MAYYCNKWFNMELNDFLKNWMPYLEFDASLEFNDLF